jgi:hypothetical protein
VVKSIDTFHSSTPLRNRQIDFTLIDIAEAPDMEPRTRTAPKPFEGIELSKTKVSTRKNASTTTKAKASKPKTVTKSRATIKKPVIKAKPKAKGTTVGKEVEEEVEEEQQVSADDVQGQNGTSMAFLSNLSEAVIVIEDESEDEPDLLQLVSTEVAITFYGKTYATIDRSNFNFNSIYEDFLQSLDTILATKTKQSLATIEAANKSIRWKWYTIAKSQYKTQPLFNAFESEEHYHQMQRDIRDTSIKNPTFRNMVMCIRVDIIKDLDNDAVILQVPTGRIVLFFYLITNIVSYNPTA